MYFHRKEIPRCCLVLRGSNSGFPPGSSKAKFDNDHYNPNKKHQDADFIDGVHGLDVEIVGSLRVIFPKEVREHFTHS